MEVAEYVSGLTEKQLVAVIVAAAQELKRRDPDLIEAAQKSLHLSVVMDISEMTPN